MNRLLIFLFLSLAILPLSPAATIMEDVGQDYVGDDVHDDYDNITFIVEVDSDLEQLLDDYDALMSELWPGAPYPDWEGNSNWPYEDCDLCIDTAFDNAIQEWNWRRWVSMVPPWEDLDSPVDYYDSDAEAYAYHNYSTAWNAAAEEVNDRIESDYVNNINEVPDFLTGPAAWAAFARAREICQEITHPGTAEFQRNEIQKARRRAKWKFKWIFSLGEPAQDLWKISEFDPDMREPEFDEVSAAKCVELMTDHFLHEMFPELELEWRKRIYDLYGTLLSISPSFEAPDHFLQGPHKPAAVEDNWPRPEEPDWQVPVRGAP